MDELLQDILNASLAVSELQVHSGKQYGLTPAVVVDRDDPLNLGRIRVDIPGKGETEWVYRIEPMPGLSLPVPQIGDTVNISYQSGDPHKPFYSGVTQNNLNPVFDKDSLELKVGVVTLRITPDGVLSITGLTSAYINDPANQIATIGAPDSDGESEGSDVLTGRGW